MPDPELPGDVLDAIATARHDLECDCGGGVHPSPLRPRRHWLSQSDETLLRIAWPHLAEHWRRTQEVAGA